MKKKLLSSLFTKVLLGFSLLLIPASGFAQAVGDYGSAGNGNWGTAGTWVVCTTAGTWDGATVATSVPSATTTINFWIRSGHTVNAEASPKYANNITIETGAKLSSDGALPSTVRYIRLSGTTLTVNGQFGSGATDGLGLYALGGTNQTITITGTGTSNISRFQPQATGQTLVIDSNTQFNYAGSSGTGSTAIYPNAFDNFTLTINSGKTLTMGNNAYLALHGSSGSSAGAVSMTININGTLTASGANSVLNLNTAAGKTVTLNIGSTGVLNLNGPIRSHFTNAGTTNINISNGAQMNCTSTGVIALSKSIITNNGTISLGGSSTDSIGATTVTTTGALLVKKTASEARMTGASTINGALTFTSGTISLGSNNLTVSSSGNISGTSSASFIITNGTGKLIQSASAATPKLFPIGASASSYDPVTVTPTSAADFTIGVSSTLSGSPVYGVRYNSKEWSIASSAPSSTVVALTPSTVTESSDPIIGLYSSSAYNNTAATISGSTFSTTVNTFGSFVTGSNVITTDLASIGSKTFISTNNNQITVQNTKSGDAIAIYTINGQLIKKFTATGSQSSSTVPSGIYLIKVNNSTSKIAL